MDSDCQRCNKSPTGVTWIDTKSAMQIHKRISNVVNDSVKLTMKASGRYRVMQAVRHKLGLPVHY